MKTSLQVRYDRLRRRMFFPKADAETFPVHPHHIKDGLFIKISAVPGAFFAEKLVSDFVVNHRVSTPRAIRVTDTEFVTQEISGASLYTKPHTADITRFGDAVHRLHALSVPGYGAISSQKLLGLWDSWGAYIRTALNAELSILKKRSVLSDSECKRIITVMKQTAFPSKHKLLHGDLAHHNVFVSKTAVTLVDWEDAVSGDPMYDVAYYETGCYSHPAWFAAFEKGYGRIQKNRLYWVYYLRAALAKTVVMIREKKKNELGDLPLGTRIRFALTKLA